MIQVSEVEKNRIRELLGEYKDKEDLKKLKTSIDTERTSRQFFEIIKPFILFISYKDSSLAEKFKEIINNPELNKIPSLLEKLDTGVCFGSHRTKQQISEIIRKNEQEISNIQTFILVLLSEELSKNKDISLSKFEFKTIKKEKKEKRKDDKSDTSNEIE